MRTVCLLFFLATSLLRADEGMWMPQQMPELEQHLKALGLQIPAKDLANPLSFPLNAVVSLGGCSASFVSENGLVITNHHCAYGAIQYNSTPENNLIANGFLAASLAEELSAGPTSRIYVTTEIKDVTQDILNGLESLEPLARTQAIEDRIKKLEGEIDKIEGYRGVVQSFYEGASFFLVTQMEIRDVRLVYAPSDKVGEYGGDIDNWMWPRHTGDWSFYRAYVGPDGKPADYAKDNVPYQPKAWLKLNTNGVGEGDFIMIAGYPGRTYRWQTSTQVADMVQEVYPARIQLFTDILGIMENIANADPDAAVKLASTMKSLNNALKNNQGMVEGLQKSDIIERKQALEKEMLAHAQKTGKDAKILDELEAIRLESREQWFARMAESFGRFLVPGIGFSAWAYEYSTMKDKPEMERDLGFQDRDVNRMKQRNKQTQRNLVLSAQKQLLAYSFKQMAKLPAADQPEAYRALFVGKSAAEMDQAIDQWIESAFAKSQLQDLAYRESLLEKSTAELEAIDDPLLQYAIARFKENKPFEEAQKTREGKLSVLRPAYIALLRDTMKAKGKAVYPDANSSLRITFGTVKGYSPRDGVYHTPQTSTRGLIQKETGETPFRSPEPLLDLAQQKQFGPYLDKKLGDVPVNFLGTCDITGGNSGSATLDGQGRLVGLVFDGNYEAMSSDYDFDVDVTRSIHVDIRYILWVMDAVDGAHNLLTEMGVQPHFKTAKAATSGTP